VLPSFELLTAIMGSIFIPFSVGTNSLASQMEQRHSRGLGSANIKLLMTKTFPIRTCKVHFLILLWLRAEKAMVCRWNPEYFESR